MSRNEKQPSCRQVTHLKQTSERIEAELAGRLAFEYKTPFKGFDSSKVKGLVARLVAVNNPKHATALEVVAGGKLYQVVVDDTDTAKALLSKGQLKRRVTILPLNRISRNGLIDGGKAAAAGAAAKAMGGTAVRAIELVGFDEGGKMVLWTQYVFVTAASLLCSVFEVMTIYETRPACTSYSFQTLGVGLITADVRAAMEFAFGDKIVCDSMDTARRVAHDPKVKET
jgi:structural maintenance of chromosome 2